MNKAVRVLHIITDLPIGGAQDNTLYTVELLDRNKYEVALACNFSGDFVERARAIHDCELHDIPSLKREVSFKNDFKALFALIRLIRDGSYDIVHTHSTKPGVLGRVACLFTKTDLVIHTVHGFPFHDFMNPLKRWVFMMVEWAMNLISTHLITVSTLNLKKIVDLRLAPRKKLTNIYSGIDIQRFQRSEALDLHAELGLDSSTKVIGFIGRFSEQKSPFTFLRALKKVSAQNQGFHVALVGDGPLREDMQLFVQDNDLGNVVSFLGYRMDVNAILKGLDLFVLSSIYEGLGRSVTEALCCEVPVVATAVEGVPELVRDKKTGLLIEPEDPDQLAEGILYALANPEIMEDYAKAGSQFVSENFPVEKMVSDIDKLYQSLMN